MIEAGTYFALLKGGITTTAKTGTPQVELSISVTHSATEDAWKEFDAPQDRTIYLFLSEAAFKYTKANLESLAFNGDFANMKFGTKFTEEGLEVECQHEEYQGKVREKWNLPGGAREVKPASADIMRKLNAQWKSQSQPKPPAGKPKPAKPSGTSIPGFGKAAPGAVGVDIMPLEEKTFAESVEADEVPI